MTRAIKSDNEKWWYGAPGIRMIYHGDWNDPELEADGFVANYYDVEQYMYDNANEDGIDGDNHEAFGQYVRDHVDDAKWFISEVGTKEEDDDFIDSGCHGKGKKDKKKKPVKSSGLNFEGGNPYRSFVRNPEGTMRKRKGYMSVEELPREALQELKQRYYTNNYDDELSYGEMDAIDDIVSDEEVFDEYGGTQFTEDDFFCLQSSKKSVKQSMQGKEKSIQAIMDEYGCTRKEAEEMLSEDIQSSRRTIKSSMVPDVSDKDLKFFAGIASMALDDVFDLYDRNQDTLIRHGYSAEDISKAQKIASVIYNMVI